MLFNTISFYAIVFGAFLGVRADAAGTKLGSFYVYGQNISGLPVFFNDEIAYIGLEAPSNASVATNITFNQHSTTSSLTATPNDTVSLSANTLYINRQAGAFGMAGFTNVSASSDNLTTTGFAFYGSQLVWISSSGELQQKWWAVAADQIGSYTLNWNVDNVLMEKAVPVVVKNEAPTSL